MGRFISQWSLSWTCMCAAVCLMLATAERASAQTVLSAQINAEANYVAACGNMMEAAARARKINAEAVALEIQNSVEYVDAYFKRREINREAWRKEHPDYMELETRRQAAVKKRVEQQYQDLLRGDLTNPLNWLLRELAGPVVSYRYLPPEQSLVHSQTDQDLTPNDLKQIMLTDGGKSSSRLVFAAADGRALQTPNWPMALRGPEFDAVRMSFEGSRDGLVRQMQERGQADRECQTQMLQNINALFVALDAAHPKGRCQNPAEYMDYATARRFLQSTLAETHRALTTNNAAALSGELRFKGDSVVGLLQHMYQTGLEFAPPRPGGEGAYKSLFQNLRTLYMKIGPDRPAVDVQPRAANGAEAARDAANKP